MGKSIPKVLVADDDPLLCDVIKSFLERKNYHVVVASNGPRTLQKLQQENPDVVLLDTYVLRKSGLDILREIRQSKDAGSIIITGVADDADAKAVLEMGAFDYIAKPFDLEHLEKVLSWNLKLNQ